MNTQEKLFAVVYHSGTAGAKLVYGDSLEQVKERENASFEKWKLENKHANLGIAAIIEVVK
jgi:hypothetical protein